MPLLVNWLLGAGLASSLTAASAPLPVHVGGRAVALPGGGYEFGWPGVYFEGRFRGPAVTISLDAPAEALEVLVDGITRQVLRRPVGRYVVAGLGPGEHTIRLQKLTESQTGSARFLGFFAEGAARSLPPPPRRARQIEIIGDSYSVGYGDQSPTRACTPAEIHDRTNTQVAYGPMAARRLDADYRVNAFSGYGMVRNYAGHDPSLSLPAIYPRLIPGDPSRTGSAEPDWRPQVVVIALGANDFSTPVQASEPWRDAAGLHAAYRSRYVAFIQGLAAQQPQARFVLLASDVFADDVEAVVRAAPARVRARTRVIVYRGLQLTGCDGHPSEADQAMLADRLVAVSRQLEPGWRAAGPPR